MRRRLMLIVAVAAMAIVPAQGAAARGGGWQPLPAPPFDAAICGTTFHLSFPVNKEYFRAAQEPDGTILLKVTGSFKVSIRADTGKSVSLLNVSGPGRSLIFPNNDFDFISQGRNILLLTPDQSKATGLPEAFITTGSVDYLFRADGTAKVNRQGHIAENLCSVLG